MLFGLSPEVMSLVLGTGFALVENVYELVDHPKLKFAPFDDTSLSRFRQSGAALYYGDASRPAMLHQIGLEDARAAGHRIQAVQPVRRRHPDLSGGRDIESLGIPGTQGVDLAFRIAEILRQG